MLEPSPHLHPEMCPQLPAPYQPQNQPSNQETSQIHRKSARRTKKRSEKSKTIAWLGAELRPHRREDIDHRSERVEVSEQGRKTCEMRREHVPLPAARRPCCLFPTLLASLLCKVSSLPPLLSLSLSCTRKQRTSQSAAASLGFSVVLLAPLLSLSSPRLLTNYFYFSLMTMNKADGCCYLLKQVRGLHTTVLV